MCNDSNDFKFLRISHFQENIDFIETYSSLKNANNRLSSIYDKFEISDKKSLINNSKIEYFIKHISYPFPNMIIIDKGRNIDEKSVILIKNSKYMGFGYFTLNYQITNYEILESLITRTNKKNNFDKLIINYLKKNKVEKIINTETSH